ncbi:MAG TPA: hypothetical protein VG867_01270, partial [Rhizomicrobium sp.]|nr:hypothetical protein [Rhizomicrobium sp.]
IVIAIKENPMKPVIAAAGFAALLLAGCTSGTYVSREDAGQFQKGTTTEDQVVAALGQPDAKADLIDGGHRDSYVRVIDGETPIDYVPLVAWVVAPRYGHTTTVNFDFDAKGVLQDVSRFREKS